ncbi:MAG: DUF4236 domain-containing protein [Ruminococcaceae bacterium]|nr:DUF4236 domain-containing protein [Oscillospiraceae bacterium]
MGFNFRKSFRIGKFLRINLSKSGIGWSVGRKGIRYTHSATGRKQATLSLPGTGISYTIPLGKAKKARSKKVKKTEKKPAVTAPEVTPALPQETAPAEQPVTCCPTAAEGSINTTAFHASGSPASEDAAPTPLQAEETASSDTTVFFSATGKCYHYKPCCAGHTYTRSSTEEEALRMGRTACSRCSGPKE